MSDLSGITFHLYLLHAPLHLRHDEIVGLQVDAALRAFVGLIRRRNHQLGSFDPTAADVVETASCMLVIQRIAFEDQNHGPYTPRNSLLSPIKSPQDG